MSSPVAKSVSKLISRKFQGKFLNLYTVAKDEKFLSLKLVSEKGLDLMAILFCEYMMMDPFATDPQWSLPIQKRPVFMKNYESFDCQEKLCKK